MFRILILLGITIAVLSIIGILIPDAITSNIDGAIVYFLGFIWNLNSVLPVATIMTCLLILADFYASVAIFYIFHWVLKTIR